MPLAIVHHPFFNADLPDGHRFPMAKFRRLAALLSETGIAADSAFHKPEPADPATIALAHDESYVLDVLEGNVPAMIERQIGLPVSEGVAMRSRCASGGTLLTARLALEQGIACNTAGGSHHARRSHGAGFCVFNDVAVAIRALQREQAIETAMVIDCDVHQGDGTAEIFAADKDVFTLSIHAEKNYPVRKVASDLDVGLPDRTGDEAYLDTVRAAVGAALERFRPDIVFYNAGVDPHAEDRLGRLALSDAGLMERDLRIIDKVRSAGIAFTGVIGGGYSSDIDALADRHATLHRAAARFV
ncbi:MAG TPA: histone deacetylase [Afifellaceae bacterium]|nr:histone deacetylase [Afifellaceae bacterium]